VAASGGDRFRDKTIVPTDTFDAFATDELRQSARGSRSLLHPMPRTQRAEEAVLGLSRD